MGIVYTALFLGSLAASTLAASGAHFPSPFGPAALSAAYFAEHAGAVRLGAFLQFGAAVPLAIFTATLVDRLRFLGMKVAGTVIALYGDLAAAFFLALSAMVQWVLAQPGVATEAGVARLLHLLAFATGGPGHVVPLACCSPEPRCRRWSEGCCRNGWRGWDWRWQRSPSCPGSASSSQEPPTCCQRPASRPSSGSWPSARCYRGRESKRAMNAIALPVEACPPDPGRADPRGRMAHHGRRQRLGHALTPNRAAPLRMIASPKWSRRK